VTDPWADPATPTEPGRPYAGPPYAGPPQTTPPPSYGSPYGPPVYGPPAYGAPQYGAPQYGAPQYWPPQSWTPQYWGHPPGHGHPAPWAPPRPPQRPGQLMAAAVLAFVQGGLVLIASLYVWFFASVAELAVRGTAGAVPGGTVDALATEGTTLAVVQLVSSVLLVAAGIRALTARTPGAWRLLLVAHAVQVALSVYWAARLSMVFDDVPGSDGHGPLVAFTLFFAAGPLVGAGLLLTWAARSWFAPAPQSAVPSPV
jgi:hypothetical protein